MSSTPRTHRRRTLLGTLASGLFVAILALALAPSPPASATSTSCTVSAKLVPSCGVFLGSTLNPLPDRNLSAPTQVLAYLEWAWARDVTFVHQYFADTAAFPTPEEVAWTTDPAHPRALAINWKPSTTQTWAAVAGGAIDPRIDAEAKRLVAYGRPMLLAISHEPEDNVIDMVGSGMRPEDYAAMYRHVVTRLRSDGVTNVAFVWDMMGYKGWGQKGYYGRLYPGDAYVDWVASDMYGADLSTMLTRAGAGWPGWYAWATSNHPGKPLAMFEFGMPNPRMTIEQEAQAYESAANEAEQFPQLRLLLHFNHGVDGVTKQSLRYDDNWLTIPAFNEMVRDPYLNPVLPITG